jgi:hypothetical protein
LPYRLEYLEALRRLSRAFDLAEARGSARPVVVGGSAVEFHTLGVVQSGDIDLVTPSADTVGEALVEVGFRREDRAGFKRGGFYYPGSSIGVEFVSGLLFDGRTDRNRLELALIDSVTKILFPPVEDLIADRLAQYEANPAGSGDMLEQARLLRSLAQDVDPVYLRKRVGEECLDPSLIDLL